MLQRLASRLLSNDKFIRHNIIRTYWNKDYKPDPYPKTQAQRMAAAKKYGIPINEYAPYPRSLEPTGDYPRIPMISNNVKDEFYPWDNPELKRNFNEPLNSNFDLLLEERYDYSTRLRDSIPVQLLQFLAGVGIYGFLMYLGEYYKIFTGTIPKQYPHRGEVHYLFEMYSGELEEINLRGSEGGTKDRHDRTGSVRQQSTDGGKKRVSKCAPK